MLKMAKTDCLFNGKYLFQCLCPEGYKAKEVNEKVHGEKLRGENKMQQASKERVSAEENTALLWDAEKLLLLSAYTSLLPV